MLLCSATQGSLQEWSQSSRRGRRRHSSIAQGFLTWATTSLRLCAVVGTHQDTVPETPSNNVKLVPRRSGAHATSQNCTIFHALMFLRISKIWAAFPIHFLVLHCRSTEKHME